MVVLKRGDWVLDGDSVGRVIAHSLRGGSDGAGGFVLVEFQEDDTYIRRDTIHESELTKIDEALYPILSDSIKEE